VRIVDLTMELADGVQTHPAHPRCVVIEFASHAATAPRFRPPCRGFASRILMFSDHIGTHVDSPFHFIPGGGAIESVPLERLVGPAVRLDVSAKPPEAPVTPAMLEAAAAAAGVRVEPGDILLVRAWPGRHGDDGFLKCAGLNREAAGWIVDRGVKALGCDLASPDDPGDLTRPVHMILLGQEIPIMEHIANLETLPEARFLFVGVPLRIRGATGSPIRAMAILNGQGA
jgi:kynurenine formamidase